MTRYPDDEGIQRNGVFLFGSLLPNALFDNLDANTRKLIVAAVTQCKARFLPLKEECRW